MEGMIGEAQLKKEKRADSEARKDNNQTYRTPELRCPLTTAETPRAARLPLSFAG